MKHFVIFGDIDFLDDENAFVRSVKHAEFVSDADLTDVAEEWGGDWIAPHYYKGKITFAKYHKESI